MPLVETTREQGIALVELRDPKALNAFSAELLGEFGAAITALRDDPPPAVVISGSGRAFSVGAALDEVLAASAEANLNYNDRLLAAFDAVAELPVPTIAAIDGFALGGGLELALACTMRVCSEGSVLGLPEVRLGLMPGAGGLERLPRTVPRSAALRLLLTGDTIDAEKAQKLSLVDAIAPAGCAVEGALAIAQRIAGAAPLAVRAVLATLAGQGAPEERRRSRSQLDDLLRSRDADEGMRAALEHRTPNFTES